jgi:hypothetical protein
MTGETELQDGTRRRLLRRGGALALLAAAGAALAACGKKDRPKPPSGDDAPYPRDYPPAS